MQKTNALFKSSCDACIKTKAKCDGISPCSTCLVKGNEKSCIFAFKRKRGPHSKPLQQNTRRLKAAKLHGFMSSYERRLWTVFFTAFKNQRVRSKDAAGPSWHWFAQQLVNIHSYASERGDEKIMYRLECFFLSLDTNLQDLQKTLAEGYFELSKSCAQCSPQTKKENYNFDVNNGVLVPQISQLQQQQFRNLFTSNAQACFVYDQEEFYGEVLVNDKFQMAFGYNDFGANNLIKWSGGGFLPWGGDIFAALFAHEDDLLLYLQIIGLKFQSCGLNTEQQYSSKGCKCKQEVEIPSRHSFECWTLDEDRTKKRSLVTFSCTHRLIMKGGETCCRTECVIESVCAPTAKKPLAGQDAVPISHFSNLVFPTPENGMSTFQHKKFSSWKCRTPPMETNTTKGKIAKSMEPDNLPSSIKTPMKKWSASSYDALLVPSDELESFNSSPGQSVGERTPLLRRGSSNKWIDGLLENWAKADEAKANEVSMP